MCRHMGLIIGTVLITLLYGVVILATASVAIVLTTILFIPGCLLLLILSIMETTSEYLMDTMFKRKMRRRRAARQTAAQIQTEIELVEAAFAEEQEQEEEAVEEAVIEEQRGIAEVEIVAEANPVYVNPIRLLRPPDHVSSRAHPRESLMR